MQGYHPFGADLKSSTGGFDRLDSRDLVPTIPFKWGSVEEEDGVGLYAKELFGEMPHYDGIK